MLATGSLIKESGFAVGNTPKLCGYVIQTIVSEIKDKYVIHRIRYVENFQGFLCKMLKNPWKTCVVRRNMIHFIQSIFSVERGGHHSKIL